jgi:hypothetical protein
VTDGKLLALMLTAECSGEALCRFARWLDLDAFVAPTSTGARALLARRIADRLGIGIVPRDGRPHYINGLPSAPSSDGCAGQTSGDDGVTGRRDGQSQRGRAVAAHRAHNPKVPGSTPGLATNTELA